MERLLAGRYELGEPLGQGATASVFVARDRRLDRAVAVKVLTTGLTADGRERFLREARAAARVNHPNVVVVYDAGVDDGRLYLAMELVEGGDLASTLADRAPLPVPEAVGIADRMLAALAALHTAGIVHRDVKPANVLLTADGGVKLTDFGIARRDDTSTLTVDGSVLGTPAYLPPEQAQGERPTPAGDLYSLGVVCYEMLAGAPPFGTGPAASVALAHVSTPLPPLRERRPEVPASLAAVVERALAKRPEDRWPTAAAMQSAVVSSLAAADPAALTQAIEKTERLRSIVAVPAPAAARPPAAAPVVLPPDPRRSARTRLLALAAGAVAALLIAVGVALANRGDGGGDAGLGVIATDATTATTAPAGSTTPATSAPPATTAPAATTTVPPTTAPSGPPSIEEVVASLEADPAAAGDKGIELFDRLREVAGEDGRDQAKKARDLLKDIDEWVGDGLLVESVAEAARAALEPLSGEGGSDEGDGDD